MATTTNYGWTTPDDTALVKDGASAIRTLGTSVDTTTKNLNPSTTLGDIEYRSSTANTNTRLGIGTTGQVLTVAGGVPTWAAAATGGLNYVGGTTFTSSATINVNNVFSATYANYLIVCDYVANVGATNNLRFRVSGTDDSNANYFTQILVASNTNVIASQVQNATQARIIDGTTSSNSFTAYVINPFASLKTQLYCYGIYSGSDSSMEIATKQISYNGTTSFTGFSILCSGTLTGTVRVYGLANS